MRIRILTGVFALAVLTAATHAVELKMKYEPGTTRTMNVDMNLEGSLEVTGDAAIQGTGEGRIGTSMDLKVLSEEDGVGTIEQKITNIDIDIQAEADTQDGPKKWDVKLTPEGGSMTADGQTTPIPADTLGDIQAQSWEVKMDAQGAPVGMEIDSSEMSQEEAEQVQQMSESLNSMIGKAALLPDGDVEEGHEWD